MNIQKMLNPYTIRHRLFMLSGIAIVMIISLVSVYSMQFVSLESKLVTMERVDDLFNGILELRRFEKNIMLMFNRDSVAEAIGAQNSIELSLKKLTPLIKVSREKKILAVLQENFNKYTKSFKQWRGSEKHKRNSRPDKEDGQQVRLLGQKLVDNASHLARLNRENISEGFKTILFWLTFMPATLFTVGAILFFYQTRSILLRLSILEQGTKNLAAGEFRIIKLPHSSPDEVSGLIDNFNQMVEALEQKQEQLIQSKKMASIGTFSSGIAHEINNPLNNISLSADILLEDFDGMDEDEIREILSDIMEQTERASKIVRNLLDFSRARAPDREPLYVDYVLHKTTDLIANELRIHKIALHKEIADNIPQVYGDQHKLQQVFLNLIINAEQAIGDYGRIVITARTVDNKYIRVDISDTGPGIFPENLDRIFDPFFTTKEAGKGTGLGLAIVYGIVEKHGGYIEVTSKIDQGTAFSVYLPVYRDIVDVEDEAEC
jgi:signal transduction histidine kinase